MPKNRGPKLVSKEVGNIESIPNWAKDKITIITEKQAVDEREEPSVIQDNLVRSSVEQTRTDEKVKEDVSIDPTSLPATTSGEKIVDDFGGVVGQVSFRWGWLEFESNGIYFP
jgi:hypothetical protein